MEREACVCDHRLERSDLCAEILIILNNDGCQENDSMIFPRSSFDSQLNSWTLANYSTFCRSTIK